jgi:uncharacterized coiled-coil protein SlyX
MYFDAAEAKLTEIETRLAALESAPAPVVDTSGLQDQITAMQTELARLDSRLDAIAAAAKD